MPKTEGPTPLKEGAPHPFEVRRDNILKDVASLRKILESDPPKGPFSGELTLSSGEKVTFDESDFEGPGLAEELDEIVARVQKVEPSDQNAEEELEWAEKKLSEIFDDLGTDDPTEMDW